MLFQSSIKVFEFSIIYFVCGHAHVPGEDQSQCFPFWRLDQVVRLGQY